MADGFLNRLLAPRVILPLLLVAIVVIVLLTPVVDGSGAAMLSTHSARPGGARAFFEATERLGWKVERRIEPFAEPLARAAVYAVLAPPIPLSAEEIHALLNAVREGAGLLYVAPDGDDLADSLGIRVRASAPAAVVDSAGVPATMVWRGEHCSGGILDLDPYRGTTLLRTIRADSTIMRDTVTLMQVIARDTPRAAAIGAALGRGRVVVLSDPVFLRNDVLKLCNHRAGVVGIRLLEWLTGSPGGQVVFDEHHHGYGTQPSTMRVMRRAMTGNALGRTVSQIIVAALVLLIAAGVRPIVPRPRKRIERRSPLEHVGALSRAYEQIGATKRGTNLLLRGLRRRRDAATWKRGSDEEFLRNVAKRYPKLASDVEVVLSATSVARKPADFIHVGEAIEHIERTLSSDNS